MGYDTPPLDDYVPTANIDTVIQLDLENRNIHDLTGIEDFEELLYLDCWFNQLTSIDVRNNINLKFLHVSFNPLSSLNVKNNTNLIGLSCSNTQLTSLDISRNTSLTNIGINDIPTLCNVCVWVLPFPPDMVFVNTTGSPNIIFTID